MKETPEYYPRFTAVGLFPSRMMSGSKSYYHDTHKGNIIVFNANIFTPKKGKVWYGDLDITLDAPVLQQMCNEIGEELIVVSEMHGRFGAEAREYKNIEESGAIAKFLPNSESYLKRIYSGTKAIQIGNITHIDGKGVGYETVKI